MRNLPLIFAAIAALALSSCDKDAVAKRTFSNNCWPATDTLTGTISIKQAGTQPIILDLELEPEYGYQNMFVKVQAIAPSGKKTELLYDLDLVAPDGTWQAEKDGKHYRYAKPLAPGLAFTETGKHQLRVFHYMRDSSLCHVHSAEMNFSKP